MADAKRVAGHPDWTTVKNAADAYVTTPILAPTLTVTAATNAATVEFTCSETIPWTGTHNNIYIAGATGGWTSINNGNDQGTGTAGTQWAATKTASNKFTIPVNSTTFGSFSGQSIVVFGNGGLDSNYLDYGTSSGTNWYQAFYQLGVMYQVLGTSSYATKALEFLDYINTLGAKGMIAPVVFDTGRADIGATLGVALAYDWFYSQMSTAQKNATVVTLNLWNDYTTTYSGVFAINDPASNYWEAHNTAVASAAYATFDENARGQEWLDWVSSNWTTDMVPTFQAPSTTPGYDNRPNSIKGFYYSGSPLTGYYAFNDIARHVKYLAMVKSATGNDLSSATDYCQRWAKNLIYQLKPDRWKTNTWGEWNGVYTGAMLYSECSMLADYISTTTEGGWMQWMYMHQSTGGSSGRPDGADSASLPDVFDRLIFDSTGRTQVDYRNTEPTYFFADGGEAFVIARDDWNDTSCYAFFKCTSDQYSASPPKNAANVELTRGSDYALVSAQFWKGNTDGITGDPELTHHGSEWANTLCYRRASDGKTADGFIGDTYQGSQIGGYRGIYLAPKVAQSSRYSFGENEFCNIYDYQDSTTNREVIYFFRSFAALGGGAYAVWDRIRSNSPNDEKRLHWHTPAASAPVISTGTATVTIGASKLAIKPILPEAASLESSQVISSGPYRVVMTDSVPGVTLNALTGFYLTSSGGTVPNISQVQSLDANFSGIVFASTPAKIAIFPNGVTAGNSSGGSYTSDQYAQCSFYSTHSDTGHYLIAGLKPGSTALITVNGATLSSTNIVSSAGTLWFASSGGAITVTRT